MVISLLLAHVVNDSDEQTVVDNIDFGKEIRVLLQRSQQLLLCGILYVDFEAALDPVIVFEYQVRQTTINTSYSLL